MNIILIGFMGSGKTTVGHHIAKVLNKRFFDLDEMVTAKYGPIANIFANEGETRFREYEAETMRAMPWSDDIVVATGGGAVVNLENAVFLRAKGHVIWLYADFNTITKRLNNDLARPLWSEDYEKMNMLFIRRNELYKRYADYKIENYELIDTLCRIRDYVSKYY